MYSKQITNEESPSSGRSRKKFKYKIFKMFNKLPLTFRIMAWYTIFLSLMLLILSTFVFQFSHRWESSELRDRLQRVSVVTASDLSKFKAYKDDVFFITYTQEGLITKGALPDGFPSQTQMSPNQVGEIITADSTYYYYDAPVHSKDFNGWLRAILPIRNTSTRTISIMYSLLVGTIAFLMIASIGGYILIKRGLKPLRTMTHAAKMIGKNNDLSQRLHIPTGGKDELHDLTTTFNGMLDSLEDSSNREKRFNSDVSHELRTPIAVIQAESEYGIKYVKDVAEAKEGFQHIQEQSKFMASLVSQLLDIARLDQAQSLPMDPVNLTKLLNSIVYDYGRLCANGPIHIKSNIKDNLYVTGHEISLRRAVTNLIDNAIKFTKSSISITAGIEKNDIVISITDNGSGIEPSDLKNIWNRLYQTESARNKKSNHGIGLGLYFVNKVVNLHNGHVSAESTPHVATTFKIFIPILNP